MRAAPFYVLNRPSARLHGGRLLACLIPIVRLFMILALCGLPCAAAAQPWADAYRTGDYQKAADLLHPVVIEPFIELTSTDPVPARHLAMLYAQGLGVARDPIAACSLAQISEMATHMAAPQYAQNISAYEAALQESQRFVREHCERLTRQDRLAASHSLGCFAFGMPEEKLTLGRQTVWVGRGGIRLAEVPEEGTPDLGCPQFVARLRALTIPPPSDAAPGVRARHFVELLAWQVGKDQRDSVTYVLQWQMYELRGEKIGSSAREQLYSIGKWPQPTLPPEFDARFSVEMIRSGHVRWRMDGAPPKRGWIMLPDEKPR